MQTRRMQTISLFVAAVLVTTAGASVARAEEAHSKEKAMSKEEKIHQAMSAAPPQISREAAVVDTDGTVLREGGNGWNCMPEAMPGSKYPMCNDDVWMKLMKAVGTKSSFQTDRVGISYMLKGDMNVNNADPFDMQQDAGEVWIQEGPHLMIVVPDVKMLEGISDDPTSGAPYVMWKGTPYAHIMVPTAGRAK